jgi:TPR repeat protein
MSLIKLNKNENIYNNKEQFDEDAILKAVLYFYNGAYNMKDIDKAIELIVYLTKKENVTAFYYLGYHYHKNKNIKEAIVNYKLAAEKGHVLSIFNLGTIYKDYEKNYVEAIKMFELANSKNYIKATYELGIIYKEGLGVEKNNEEAFKFFDYAANNTNVDAIYETAICYYKGIGVAQNKVKAIDLFKLGTKLNHKLSVIYYGEILLIDNDGYKNVDRAFEIFNTLHQEGYIYGTYYVGYCYYHGIAVPENRRIAFDLFRLASSKGLLKGTYYLALLYSTGVEEIKKDPVKSFKLRKIVSDSGYPKAIYSIGLSYFTGTGVEKNLNEAFKYFHKAASTKYNDAIYYLSICYENGYGVKKNLIESDRLLKISSDLGSTLAKNYISKKTSIDSLCVAAEIEYDNNNKRIKLN